MLKTLKIFIIMIFTANLFLFVFSCTEEKENKEKCMLSERDISPNIKSIWMDTVITSGEYPKMDTVLIRFENMSADEITDEIIKDIYFYTEGWVKYPEMNSSWAALGRCLNLSPMTFWIEVEKGKNKKIDSLIASVWVTDDNCKDYEKVSIPFYKYKETDDSYILTTQLIENDEFVAGRPIFLVNEYAYVNARNYNTRSYEIDNIILLPVDSDGHDVMAVANKIHTNIKLNVEINIFEYKDTLKTILWNCEPMLSYED